MQRDKIRPSDIVLHTPSGETWTVCGVNRALGKLIPCGYPFPTVANIEDCELVVEKYSVTGQPEEYVRALRKAGYESFIYPPTAEGKTEIVKIKGDWQEVANDCRATVGKPELGKEPSSEFKRKLLIAEHSPIRDLLVKWRWLGIPHWVAVHWVRHKFEKFVQSQREDRTGIPRSKLSQAEPQDFVGEANVQQLIDVWRKRLCYKCSPETRHLAEDFKRELQGHLPEVSAVLVPNCVYRCGCPEPTSCGFWWDFVAWNPEAETGTIQERYDIYNKDFAERRGWTA